MKNIKSRRGFSLVELMVVVAIMGTLAAIAIPAYNEYRKSAKKTAYKTDLLSLHKGWLAFGVELDSFCERDTAPTDASLDTVGMQSLYSSKLYGTNPGKKNFIGFEAPASGCTLNTWDNTTKKYTATARTTHVITTNSPTDTQKKDSIGFAQVAGDAGTACDLDVDGYKLGVAGHLSGDKGIALNVDDEGVVTEKAEGTLDSTYVQAACS